MYSLDWPRVYGMPKSTASFKLTPDDFEVHEYCTETFSGSGEHIILKIEKRGITTEELVKSLARLINKPAKMISYAGLKDRQALTTQWLSVHAPGEEIPGIETLHCPQWRVIECTRHHRKLRPGFLIGNRFIIKLRALTGEEDFIQRLEQIKMAGVPNYFGEQRFGREAGNLLKAEELLVQGKKVKDKFLKGIYFSAARSWIFNLILAKRVQENCWNSPLAGDIMQLSGSSSIFVIEESSSELIQRIKEKDISPASPLPGKTKNKVSGCASELINTIYTEYSPWIKGLELYGLEEAWRSNILHVEHLEYHVEDKIAELSFTLTAGSYATALLRELVLY